MNKQTPITRYKIILYLATIGDGYWRDPLESLLNWLEANGYSRKTMKQRIHQEALTEENVGKVRHKIDYEALLIICDFLNQKGVTKDGAAPIELADLFNEGQLPLALPSQSHEPVIT